MIAALAALAACIAAVPDGDTLRLCSGERIRIVGIDAPEMGRCARGRRCVRGDGPAARKELKRFLASGPVTIVRSGRDRYGRTLGDARIGNRSAACHMLRSRHAVSRYDGGKTARRCRLQ